ncbi:MAG: metalloregulator ArsR/SmtB family transcription factor [Candidatus Kapabacteria bacterium]|jgi:DNA-binding transcriptional ArsR family regulator|nr:metalloregulator ArsR/SmtB family transcription factor [Candidatus Kapabacteria bacterium]
MAQTKADLFQEDEIMCASYAKALSHPARVAILKVLAQRKSCVCGDIVEELPLAQATVSQHLKELKEVGLIQGTIDGPSVCYCINPEGLQRAQKLLSGLFTAAAKCCG